MSDQTVALFRGLLAPIYVPWLGMSLCLGMVSLAPAHCVFRESQQRRDSICVLGNFKS